MWSSAKLQPGVMQMDMEMLAYITLCGSMGELQEQQIHGPNRVENPRPSSKFSKQKLAEKRVLPKDN